MNARVEERVEDWNSRRFTGGYAGLRDLADEGFSGVVDTDAGIWLCMLNGSVVGVFDGRIDDFEGAAGTTYVAPDPSLPLLFAMWESDATLEEQYYTNDTSIAEADDTLSSGGFSGYIELSENVLSGDYYVCYYGDRSMSVAFVGSSERLVTGDEAFERADDEVGIYDVYSVDLEVVDLPDPPEPETASGGAGDPVTAGSAEEPAPPTGDPGSDPAGTAGDPPNSRADDGGTADAEGTAPDDGSSGRSPPADSRGGPDGGDPLDDSDPLERSDPDPAEGPADPARPGGSGTADPPEGPPPSGRRDDPDPLEGTGETDPLDAPADPQEGGVDADPVEDQGGTDPVGRDPDRRASDADAGAGDREDPHSAGYADPDRRDGRDDPERAPSDPVPDHDPDRRDGRNDPERAPSDPDPDRRDRTDPRNRTTERDDRADRTGDDHDGSRPPGPDEGRAPGSDGREPGPDRGRERDDGGPGEEAVERGREDDSAGGPPDRSSGRDPGEDGYRRDSRAGRQEREDRRRTDTEGEGGHRRADGEAGEGRRRTDADRTRESRGEPRDRRDPNPEDRRRPRDRSPEHQSDQDAGSPGRRDRGDRGRQDGSPRERSGEPAPDGEARRGDRSGTDHRSGEPAPGEGDSRRADARGADDRRNRAGRGDRPRDDRRASADEIRERIRRHEEAIERLRKRVAGIEDDRETDRLRAEIDDLAGDLGQLRRTVMRLDRTVERLESDVEAGGDADDGGSTQAPQPDRNGDPSGNDGGGGPDLTADRALEETRVLVRYSSQGKATLKTAHKGGADREEVESNLQLSAHTSFEDGAATVEGTPYREFLHGRIEYRFFEWLVRDLLYEIRDTGNGDALADLYDAIPRIDRAEFRGSVEVDGEDGEDGTESVQFDLVVRDDRDRPLVVANFLESRDPATEGMVVELQDRATDVHAAAGLEAAVLVTTSYFAGAARDTAEEATGGTLLGRSQKKSYVRRSRKRGFHLCLVAESDGDFHLKVPEL